MTRLASIIEAATGQFDGDHTDAYGPGGVRLERSVDAEVTGYTWAPGGQLTSETDGVTTTSRAYDAAGRLTQASDGTVETTWVHDGAGRPVERTAGSAGCHAAGTCGEESVRRFDGDGRLVGVDESSYVWDPAGAQLGRAAQILESTVEGGWLNGTSIRSNYGLERLYVDWEAPSGAGLAYWLAAKAAMAVSATRKRRRGPGSRTGSPTTTWGRPSTPPPTTRRAPTTRSACPTRRPAAGSATGAS